MRFTLYTVDAFTDVPFQGNPAAVCLSDGPCDEKWMRLVAREMNLSETAFVHPVAGGYSLRWLTPTVEVDLCGHATLAAAFVLWQTGTLGVAQKASFHTRSGWVECVREGDWIALDFPSLPAAACEAPAGLVEALGCEALATGFNGMDYLVEVGDAEILRNLKPDLGALARMPARGVMVTSVSDSAHWDFLSRFFAPAVGVDEDPVTGSAHCALGPYWGEKLGKIELRAYQASRRGGELSVVLAGERVVLRGRAVLMSRVELQH